MLVLFWAFWREKDLKYNKNRWWLCSSKGNITCSQESLKRFCWVLFFFLTVGLILLNNIGFGWKSISNWIKAFPPTGHYSEETFCLPREDRQLKQQVSSDSQRGEKEREALSWGCPSESWHLSSEVDSWSKVNLLVIPACCAVIYIMGWFWWTCTAFISEKTKMKHAVKGWTYHAPGANGHSVPGASLELAWNGASREHVSSRPKVVLCRSSCCATLEDSNLGQSYLIKRNWILAMISRFLNL